MIEIDYENRLFEYLTGPAAVFYEYGADDGRLLKEAAKRIVLWKLIDDDTPRDTPVLLSDGDHVTTGCVSDSDRGDFWCPTSDHSDIAATHWAPNPAPLALGVTGKESGTK